MTATRTATAALSCLLTISLLLGHGAAEAALKKKKKKASVRKAVAVVVAPLAVATLDQLQAAQRVLVGRYACEFDRNIDVAHHEKEAGYFRLHLGSQHWVMKPILTSTGTIRLESVTGNTMLMQILTKSMVLDTKAGRRLVDGCVHAAQQEAQDRLQGQPVQSNL